VLKDTEDNEAYTRHRLLSLWNSLKKNDDIAKAQEGLAMALFELQKASKEKAFFFDKEGNSYLPGGLHSELVRMTRLLVETMNSEELFHPSEFNYSEGYVKHLFVKVVALEIQEFVDNNPKHVADMARR